MLSDDRKAKDEKKLRKKLKEIESLEKLSRDLNDDESRKLKSKEELLR